MPAFEQAKALHVLDREAIVIGRMNLTGYIFDGCTLCVFENRNILLNFFLNASCLVGPYRSDFSNSLLTCSVVLEKQIIAYLLNKFATFYGPKDSLHHRY
jgi:hypothetical protein